MHAVHAGHGGPAPGITDGQGSDGTAEINTSHGETRETARRSADCPESKDAKNTTATESSVSLPGAQHRPADRAMAGLLDARAPIEDVDLTFATVLPAVSVPPGAVDAPPPPDLTAYTDPHQWPTGRKNVMLLLSCAATLLTAYSAGAYSPPAALMAAEYGVSKTAALIGITTFTAGFAAAPMVLAPFSEVNGRYPVFAVSGVLYVVFQAVSGLVTSLAGMLVARLVVGIGGSTFSTMVGGVIADIWHKEERNTPMALFSGAVLVGTALGPLVSSILVFRLGDGPSTGPAAAWRWIFWHQVIADALLVLAIILLFHESRASVLLVRKARKLNKYYEDLEASGFFGVWIRDTPDAHHHHPEPPALDSGRDTLDDAEKAMGTVPESPTRLTPPPGYRLRRIRWVVQEEQHASIAQMISVSLTRPFRLLLTEPVVFFFSLWVSFAWATLYLTFGSIPLVFARVYGFNAEQAGYVFIAMVVGSLLATLIGVFQERLLGYAKWSKGAEEEAGTGTATSAFWAFMRRRFPVEAPESRLYFICIFSGFLPLGLYIFGFTAHPSVHWISPAIGVGLATSGIYFIYLATFNYLADTYQTYASSAIAAQSFCRNMLGGVFPLVVTPLFVNLGEARAGAVLGAIATALTAVPWVLALFGERIRRRSRFAVSLARE